MKQNKKAELYFSAMIALIVLPIVILFAISQTSEIKKPYDLPIGRDTSTLLKADSNAMNAIDYLEISAKFAAHQAAYDIGQKGGGSECGSKREYSYWSKVCYPQNIEQNFLLLFTSYLDDYLRNYPDLAFPLGNYEFTISGSKIIGIANNPLTAYIEGIESRHIGYYNIKPSFTVDIGYDIKDTYDKLKYFALVSEAEGSSSIVNYTLDCAKGDKTMNSVCVAKAVSILNKVLPKYEISFDQISQDIFTFDIITKKNILAYSAEDQEPQRLDITVKFLIDFSKVQNKEVEQLGDPVEFIPLIITSKSVDSNCPSVEVEDIPDYIDCSSAYYCKLAPEANKMIQEAQKYASELYGYKLNISSAYRTYEQQMLYFNIYQGESPVDKPSCDAPHVLGKSVRLTFSNVDMGDIPLADFTHSERQKLKKVMETAGWVSHDKDYKRFECCGTQLYLEKKFKDINFTDLSQVPFEFVNEEDEPGLGEKKELVYLHDVWEIAKKENVNYHFILAIMATESNFKFTNEKNDGKAHGVMQMFKAALGDVYSSLQRNYPRLASLESNYVQETLFTSPSRDNVKIQIHGGVLYIKKVKTYLAKGGKPTDVQTIIQAYHDGSGYIRKDGTSKFCELNTPEMCDESQRYYGKVEKFYRESIA